MSNKKKVVRLTESELVSLVETIVETTKKEKETINEYDLSYREDYEIQKEMDNKSWVKGKGKRGDAGEGEFTYYELRELWGSNLNDMARTANKWGMILSTYKNESVLVLSDNFSGAYKL